MDTIIFALMFLTLLAMFRRQRGLALTMFFLALAAMLYLFHFHLSDRLTLSF